jgi:hypothetical protein
LYHYLVHAWDYAENEIVSSEGNFTTSAIPQYKFEMPDNANGFPALSYARWIANYELRNITGFSSMNLAQFLTASEGDSKLAYDDVNNAYIYDSNGNWTVLANNEFTTGWHFGNHNPGFIGYYVLDLKASGLRKFVRHLTGPDQTAPTFTVVDGTATGPVKTDTINVTITGAADGFYGYSVDAVCNSTDTIDQEFASAVAFAVAGDHTDYICAKSTDTSANTGYYLVGQLNTDNTAPTVALAYSANPASAGMLNITATYSEAIVGTPTIDINQQGTTDISGTAMSGGPAVWTYVYTVHVANSSEYVDGIAIVGLSAMADAAGNNATGPTGTVFNISTTVPG